VTDKEATDHIILYRDDFKSDAIWMQLCEVTGMPRDVYGISIPFAKALVKEVEEE
jgi:hypothetical protein